MTDKESIYQENTKINKKNPQISINKLEMAWVDNSQRKKWKQLIYMELYVKLHSRSKLNI